MVDLNGRTVLVVDDEPVVNLTMSLLLRRAGATVLQAYNGAEALTIVLAKPVDAMVCDREMPVMGGLELLRELDLCGGRVPTLLFSGDVVEDGAELRALGVRRVMMKPVQPEVLLEMVAAVIAEGAR